MKKLPVIIAAFAAVTSALFAQTLTVTAPIPVIVKPRVASNSFTPE